MFEEVAFGYHDQRRVIDGVTLSIEPGSRVALVGVSGAGKSTLVKLLFRFYDPVAGRVCIDGQDIKYVTQSSLRRQIAIVPQDTVLFNDSLLENVRYGNPDAGDAAVSQAIRAAHLDDFVGQLPEGLHTRVGERGLKLSGGEKQRVAIARAILKDAPILVFDEATSSLDSHSEQAVLSAFRDLAQRHTTLVIAHRLSTVVDADQIVVLSDGTIAESGTHDELLSRGGEYARLWQAQQARQSTAPERDSGPC